MKKYFIIWLILTLAITFFLYQSAKGGGTSEHPVYLSLAQQQNPFNIFLEFLPFGAFISGVITVVGVVILKFIK